MGRDLLITVILFLMVDLALMAQESVVKADSSGSTASKEATFIESAAKDTLKSEKPVQISPWYFGVNAGYGYRLFKPLIRLSAADAQYLKDLKPGLSFRADGGYFPWKRAGFGLKYDYYHTKGDSKTRADNVTVQFIGPSVMYRQFLKNERNTILTAFSMGYQGFQNKGRSGTEEYQLRGKSMGWGVSVGLDHKLSSKFAISLAASCLMGTAFKLTREAGGKTETIRLSKDNFEDLSRFALTAGFKFL